MPKMKWSELSPIQMEWGISCANKNLPLLEKYRAEKYLEQ